jgi:hypothetical protein
MWAIVILVVMSALSGYYVLVDETYQAPVADMKALDLAGDMGVYRAAVMAYLRANPGFSSGTVPDTALAATFPSWYVRSPLWTNYVAADGTIAVYASTLPAMKIVSQLFAESQRSILVGEADSGTNTLRSPVYGNTGIPLPAGAAIPNGSPVWLARRN